MKLKIATWKHNSYAEGPRRNTTVWVSGCKIRCPGCFNLELWDGRLGKEVSLGEILRLVWKGRGLGDRGLAFVGGEPFDQAEALGLACRAVHRFFPEHVITIYTGYRLEALLRRPNATLALETAHYLVDGPFILSLADPNLGYRGSKNQRVIDLQASRENAFQKIALANWDGLLVYDRGVLSGPPAILKMEGTDNDYSCGKYGLETADPA